MPISKFSHYVVVPAFAMMLIGCSANTPNEVVVPTNGETIAEQETFVEFKSELGNTIVHPSQWVPKDDGNAFSLASPDGHAVITVSTFTVEGTGTLTQFQNTIVSQIEGDWRDSEWTDIDIGGINAKKRKLDPANDDAESSWCVYVLRSGECYHAIVLSASTVAMGLNGGFYENVIQSFEGVSTVP